mgnify:CR=1 FL=1
MKTLYRIVNVGGGEWLSADGTTCTSERAVTFEYWSTAALHILEARGDPGRWTVEPCTPAAS